MKICMIGLGSIGRRHICNLVRVLEESKEEYSIDALRSGKTKLAKNIAQYISTEYFKIDEMPNNYDVIFITNPTSEHYSTITVVASKTKHMFIEKPVFSTLKVNIDALHLSNDGIYYVACPLRHRVLMKRIQDIVKEEKIFSVQAICSSYLPEWRPNTDYRKCYSARSELGGGVTLDLIHEWDYLIDLFGFPKEVKRLIGKYSDLEMDADDLSVYIAKYEDKVIEIHLDYFGRKAQRKLILFCKNYVIEADFLTNEILYNGECHRMVKVDETDPYVSEMKYFFELIKNKRENINTLQNAMNVLQVALSQ